MRVHSEVNLSEMIDSTKDLIWAVDLDGRLITCNHAWRQRCQETYGVTPAAGMRLEDFLPPERAALWLSLRERARTEGSFQIEQTLANDYTVELTFNPIVVDGKTTGISIFGKDITKRKAAEKALEEAEKKYRTIFDGAIEGIFQASPEGKIVAINRAALMILGYDSLDDFKSSVADLREQLWVDAEERARFQKQFDEQGVVRGFECRIQRKNGTIFWSLLSARKVSDADGQYRYVEGFLLDITEHKQAEMALRESEMSYRSTVEQAAVGIAHISFEGHYLRCNARFVEIAGYPLEEIPSLTIQQMIHPDDLAENELIRARLSKGEIDHAHFEERLIRKDGSLTWIRMTTWAQRDSEGRLLHMVSMAEDINARKVAEQKLAEAQEALRSSEELYRVAFQNSIDAIIISRLEDGKLIDVNQAFLLLMGYEREEVIGKNVQELHLWKNAPDRQRLIAALRKDSVCQDMEFPFRKKNGQIFWALLSGSLIELAGVSSIHLVARDISAARTATEALRMSEERYRVAFQTSTDAITISSIADEKLIDINQAALRMFGFKRDAVLGCTLDELHVWSSPEDRLRLIKTLNEDRFCRDMEFQLCKKNGQKLWVLISGSRIELAGVSSIHLVIRDISAAKTATEALRMSEERYRAVFYTSLDAIGINRLSDGKFVDCNQALLDDLRYKREEVLGHTPGELGIWANPNDQLAMEKMVRENSVCRRLETQFKKKNGDVLWAELSASTMEINGIPHILCITRDMSTAKAAENTIRSLAFYDPLTGMPNRRMLMDRLFQPLAESASSSHLKALLMIELDNFKTLNDTLGHQKGDLLLQEVARRIAACIHDTDTMYQLGRDEFVVMHQDLSEVTEEAANHVRDIGERILASISRPFLIEGHEYLSTSSIGITVFKNQPVSAEDLLQQADIALHQAEAAGRNALRFFSPALQTTVNARAAMEDDLRQAIKKDQFQLYYQPQVKMDRLTGAEALIRWRHPSRGLVPPDDFIPMAEETGLILPLGEWILNTAFRQVATWENQKQHDKFGVSVNISALQFRQPEFVQQVLQALERTGSDPRNLKLELTESILAENIDEVIAKMNELKSHGLRFSLDDFGTGYSSLSYLKRLPLDELKIDRAFVRDMLEDVTSGAIAQTIISIGHAMGLSVIAEGVETEEQRKFLADLGCHSFQGYLYSHPLPVDEFQKYLKKFTKNISFAGK